MLCLLLLVFVIAPSSSGPICQCASRTAWLPTLLLSFKNSVCGELKPIPLGRRAKAVLTALIRFVFDVNLFFLVFVLAPSPNQLIRSVALLSYCDNNQILCAREISLLKATAVAFS